MPKAYEGFESLVYIAGARKTVLRGDFSDPLSTTRVRAVEKNREHQEQTNQESLILNLPLTSSVVL